MKSSPWIAAALLAACALWQFVPGTAKLRPLARPGPGLSSLPPESALGTPASRQPPDPNASRATSAQVGPAMPAGLGALTTQNQLSLQEQMRAARRWFAYAGETSNGSPRLIASVPAQRFDFIADDREVSVRPWSGATGFGASS